MSVSPAAPSTLPLGGYADLAAEIRGLGLMRRRPGFYAVLFAGILLALGAGVAGVLLLRDSWWALLLAPVLGVVSTQLGFFGHDAAHRQITRRERPSRWIALVTANLLNGLSYGWWLEKHNAHHAHPNDLESDPDVHAGAFVFDARRRWVGAARRLVPGTRPGSSSRCCSSRPSTCTWPASVRCCGRGCGTGAWRWCCSCATSRRTSPARRRADLAAGAGLRRRAPGGVRRLPGDVVRARPQGDAGARAREQAADPLLRQVLTSRNVRGGRFVTRARRAELPDRAPPVPEHAAARTWPGRSRWSVGSATSAGSSYAEVSVVATYAAVVRHLDAVGADLRASRTRARPAPAVTRGYGRSTRRTTRANRPRAMRRRAAGPGPRGRATRLHKGRGRFTRRMRLLERP